MLFRIIMISCIFITFITLSSANKPKKNMFMAVTLPYDVLESDFIKEVQKEYKSMCNKVYLLMLLTAIPCVFPFWIFKNTTVYIFYLMLWCMGFAYYGIIPFKLMNRKIKAEKAKNGWFVGEKKVVYCDTKTTLLKNSMPISNKYFLIPILIGIIPLILSIKNFSSENIAFLIVAILNLGLVILLFYIAKVFNKNKLKTYSTDSEINFILNKTENLNAIKENVEKITKQFDSIKTEYLYLSSSLKIDDLKSKVEEINKNSRIVEQIEEENSSLKLKKEEIDSNLNQKRNAFIELDKNISSLNKENESNQKDKVEKETEFNLITKGQNPKHLLNNIIDEIDSITSTEAKLRVEVEEEKYATEKLKSKISQVKGKLEESKDKYKSSKENLKELLFEYKFESIYAVKNALIDETEREKLKDEIEFFEKEEKTLSAEIKTLKEKLDKKTVNLDEFLNLEKNKYKLAHDIDEITKEIGAKQNEVMTLEKNLKKVKELQKQLDESEHKLELLKEIEKLLQGKRFVEFVAKNQLEYIVIEASKRLDIMTKGRYVLEIDDNLNFVIRDNYNGGLRRSIKTLSGGETFLTSLALALALSSQIQLKGSAPLEFFFLDEGFGSLDNELLDIVMESLEKLHSEQLSVGIISHVEELKNRVPVKLIVTPNDGGNGSKINIEYS